MQQPRSLFLDWKIKPIFQFTRVYKMADEKRSKAKSKKSEKTSNIGADNRFSWSSEIIQVYLMRYWITKAIWNVTIRI